MLAGKLLAALPVVPVTAGLSVLAGWAFAVDTGHAGLDAVRLLWEGTVAGGGMLAIPGAGAPEAPRQIAPLPVDEAYQQWFEQVPTGVFSQVGLLAAGAFGAARIWGSPALAAAAGAVPILFLSAGWLRLDWFLRGGRSR